MIDRFTGQLLIFVLSVGWSLILYFGQRIFRTMDRKLDASFERIEKTNHDFRKMVEKHESKMERAVKTLAGKVGRHLRRLHAKIESQGQLHQNEFERQNKAYNRLFVTRQEFGAFTAAINHKIDSIYELLSKEGIKTK